MLKKTFRWLAGRLLPTAVCLAGLVFFAPSVQAALKFTLNTSRKNIVIGETYQLSIKRVPSGQTKKGAVWSSGNKKIASVDSSGGLVTAKKVGVTTIRVRSKNGRVTGKATVRVVSNVYKMTMKTKKLVIGETYTLAVKRAVGQDAAVSWTSSDTTVAAVDAKTGKVTAKKEGTARITAKNAAGTISGTTVVTVTGNTYTLNAYAAGIAVGDTCAFKIKKAPSGVKKKVTWSSDNPAVAQVNSKTGVVTGKTRGSAVITATSKDHQQKVTAAAVVEVYDWAEAEIRMTGNYQKYQLPVYTKKMQVTVNGAEHVVKTSTLKKNMTTLYNAFLKGQTKKITYSVVGNRKSTLQVRGAVRKVIMTTADGQKHTFTYTSQVNAEDQSVKVTLTGVSAGKYTLLMEKPAGNSADFRLYLGDNTVGLISEVRYTGNEWILYSLNTPHIRLDKVKYWTH